MRSYNVEMTPSNNREMIRDAIGVFFGMWGAFPTVNVHCRCYALLLTRTVNAPLELYEA
jgi:hypothetical protein